MALVKYIKSAIDIPAKDRYVIVQFGAAKKEIRHSRGVIMIVAESPPDRSQGEFLASLNRAQRLAEKEGIATIYAIDRRKASRAKAAKKDLD
jgi:hypothetical protein